MIRKDVVIAILATFCLTSTLFMITTSKSQSGVGEYNPWADINGDGTIDIFDIVPVAVSFGSEGDSTKNVNVTNWQTPKSEYEILHWNINITAGSGGTPLDIVYCGGYSRLAFSFQPLEMSQGTYTFNIYTAYLNWYADSFTNGPTNDFPKFTLTVERSIGQVGYSFPLPLVIETKGPYFRLWLGANSTVAGSWGVFEVYAYLRNE